MPATFSLKPVNLTGASSDGECSSSSFSTSSSTSCNSYVTRACTIGHNVFRIPNCIIQNCKIHFVCQSHQFTPNSSSGADSSPSSSDSTMKSSRRTSSSLSLSTSLSSLAASSPPSLATLSRAALSSRQMARRSPPAPQSTVLPTCRFVYSYKLICITE